MTAHNKNRYLSLTFCQRTGEDLPTEDVNTLRRAQMTLHRWHEEECNGTIQRDEEDGKPYRYMLQYGRYPIGDREAGAIRRVKEVCSRLGIYFYVQTDPRGCSLYVSDKPIDCQNYTNGVACCV